LWDLSEISSAFILPLVLSKFQARPSHNLPQALHFEVPIEHPTKLEISAFGVMFDFDPGISNFKMNLRRRLRNMPFNGWFMTSEIVRNLMGGELYMLTSQPMPGIGHGQQLFETTSKC
jgi:nitric oxide synthase oxygenase domain/subunit